MKEDYINSLNAHEMLMLKDENLRPSNHHYAKGTLHYL